MKRVALAALCLALAGCGEEETGGDGACADAIIVNGVVYLGTSIPGPDPPAGGPVEGGVQPGCNDGGPLEADREIGLREVRGVPPEVAVYREYGISTIYVNLAYPTEVPEHPLHDHFHGGPDRPRRPERGRPCRFDGEVDRTTFGILVRHGTDERDVRIDARTKIEGFDRNGLPHLGRGARVSIRGYGCGGDAMLARRIVPQP
jgi:hypothetical protein